MANLASRGTRKSGNNVLRTIMVVLNVVFYGSALAGGIKLLHDLPQSSAAPQSAPVAAPESAPSAVPQTVPSQQQAQLAQYSALRDLGANRHVTMSFLPR